LGKLFGTDGIRGETGSALTPLTALQLAMAFGEVIPRQSGRIVIGKDTRLSGYMLESAIASGLTAMGFEVIQVGVLPTPAISFLTTDMRCDGGIMITASHNPYTDNGLKFFDRQGEKLSDEMEKKIEELYFKKKFRYKKGDEIGRARRIEDGIGRYIVHLKKLFPVGEGLCGVRIVVDCANGATYKVAPIVYEELGADVIPIHNTPNGRNINRHAGALYPNFLSEQVKKYRADIGFAFDGDGDRLVVVDENGKVVDGDHLIGGIALYLKEIGELEGGVVVTIMSNLGLEEFLKREKIPIYRSPVGDRNVYKLMKEIGSNFGGEQSGHIIFRKYAQTGDGILTSLLLLRLLQEKQKRASYLHSLFPLYPQHQKAIRVKEKIPIGEIEGAEQIIRKVENRGYRVVIRYSGTEQKLRILVEGKDSEGVGDAVEELSRFFKDRLE